MMILRAKLARLILAVMIRCQDASVRLYEQTRTILERKRARTGSALALLTAGALAFLVGLPLLHAYNDGSADDRGLFVQEDWRGTWEVTVSYRDARTGALVATDVTTDAICPGEPIVPPLLNSLLRVSGDANDSAINLSCRAKHSPRPGCNAFVDISFASHRDGDTWNGTGSWSARVVGHCEHLSFGENFVVSARRVSSEAVCDGERLSLVERFFAHSALIPVLGGSD